jgi:anti-sigma regulatory factor (Ser/Thr protein kinase)
MHSGFALTSHPPSPAESPEGFRVRIGGGPRAAGRARDELGRLSADLHGQVVERLRLLVTELVTNSVRHAGATTVELAVLVGAERVRVEIANPGASFTPRVGTAGRESESGWGLFLVDRLSDLWGVVDDPGYQRIWFELKRT